MEGSNERKITLDRQGSSSELFYSKSTDGEPIYVREKKNDDDEHYLKAAEALQFQNEKIGLNQTRRLWTDLLIYSTETNPSISA